MAPHPSRSARLRRVLLTTAAAGVVVLVPTACDYAVAADRFPTGPDVGQQHGHSGHSAATTTPAATGGAQGSGEGATPPAGTTAPPTPSAPPPSEAPPSSGAGPSSVAAPPSQAGAPAQGGQPGNGLEVLARDCDGSDLPQHTGFQVAPACVDTAFGEVGAASKNPSLLITDAPRTVAAGQAFQLKVSTRNLVRDRFLAAGAGGYYVESSVLTAEGLVRGHFHTACRMLSSTSEAVDPAPVPAFFVATEDKKGGERPDTVTIQVPGLPQEGTAQCASWAGDGSHRVPMMQRANQTPAFDAVRVKVEGGDEAEEPPAEEPPADNGGGNNGGNNGGGDNGGDNGQGDGDNGQGDGDNGGGDNGGGDNDEGEAPNPGATTPPKTNTGTTPPKTDTVTIPPKNGNSAPKPAKTTKPATATKPASDSGDEDGTDAGSDDSDSPAQGVAGKTAKPTPAKKKTTEPAAQVVTNDDSGDDGAPDLQAEQNVQTADSSKLALTGANSMTIILGGALLVLSGLVIVSATRRRRAAGRD